MSKTQKTKYRHYKNKKTKKKYLIHDNSYFLNWVVSQTGGTVSKLVNSVDTFYHDDEIIPYYGFEHLNITLQDPNMYTTGDKILNLFGKLKNLFGKKKSSKFVNNFLKKYEFTNKLPINFNAFKPIGLWFSCGSSWFNWCYSEHMDDWISDKDVFNLILDESKLCIIDNINKLKEFHSEYAVPFTFKYFGDEDVYEMLGKPIILSSLKNNTTHNTLLIQWGRVSEKYSGFKLCPYFKNEIKNLTEQGNEDFTHTKGPASPMHTDSKIGDFLNKYASMMLRNELMRAHFEASVQEPTEGVVVPRAINFDYFWVYALDSASGCIWNPDCIKDIKYGGYLPHINKKSSNYYLKNIFNRFKNILEKLK